MSKLLAFPWYGGKCSHLKWLLPIIDSTPHKTYVESFGGSAAVLLNKKQSPVEVYNDSFSEVVNFFRVLRNRKEELISSLELTLYSREEFTYACQKPDVDELEKARLFFVMARQVTMGLATTATPGRWAYAIKDSRRGMSLTNSRWLNAIDGLTDVCERLRVVEIENLDAFDILKRYDREDTLHYVDPPYLMNTRSGGKGYKYEFSEEKHIQLLKLLKQLSGKILLSGYDNELYNDYLKDWNKHKDKEKISASTRGQKCSIRQEVLWSN